MDQQLIGAVDPVGRRYGWMGVSIIVVMLMIPFLVSGQNYATDLVNPFVGTGGHGHTFPGACVPNGLVQLSPDTRPDPVEWDGCGGYHYSDSVIFGFTHTHLSGTGVADLCDVLLAPVTEPFAYGEEVYSSTFSHEKELAHAGYYKVHMDRSDVDVELTATNRVGVHRYHFPKDAEARVLLDIQHRDKLIEGDILMMSPTEIVGERRSSSWATDQRLFYCIQFSKPMERDAMSADVFNELTGIFNFGKLREPLVVKVGISAVSIEGARKNLEAEVPHWDFDKVRKQAEDAWNEKLGKINVEGGTLEKQRIFYTALYHCYIAPYIFNDVDGQYRGMDGKVHKADHNVCTVFSLWDTFRALHPLMTILEPEMTNDWIKTFLLHYQQGGKLPVWELWGNETDCMIGYHSVSVIADAYMKGIRGFDADLALKAMVSSAMADDPCLNAYRTRGYISSEDCAESVSKTLEYAYDDWCIAQMAQAMGKDSLAEAFFIRSHNWRNLFDPETKFFRPRRNGGFIEPFDPYEVNFHYTEANAWQYLMFVPHDLPKFVELMGGNDSLKNRLDELFTARSSTTGRDQADITGLIGQYAHGNEPSHHMAYLYAWLGDQMKSKEQIHKIMDELYSNDPAGLSGNEDCGQMSAWYVMSALGIYPICPGDPTMVTNADPPIKAEVVRSANDIDRIIEIVEDRSEIDIPKAPIVIAENASFMESMDLRVNGEGDCSYRDAQGVHPCPMNEPFLITETSTVSVEWSEFHVPITAHFTRIDHDRSIQLNSEYANQYAASGDNALIDGLRGGKDFRTGEWQGYQGQDVSFSIDLGTMQIVDSIGIGMLQDMRSWIWFPEQVQIATSRNERQWSTTTLSPEVDRKLEQGMTMDLWTGPLNRKARFIKVIAKNAGPCPEWHLGNGGESWIFLDEVLIKAH